MQKRLKDFYIPEITSITFDGQYVEAPQPVSWYPDQLAWFMTTPKHIIRRFAPFKSFQNFLVAETDVGNITRQEIVSMIPPLVMDLKPGMTVLDLCAAPGSKSAQLIEMLHAGEEDRAREVASHLANGLDRPEGQDYEDDGRSTGLLIANDVDYKRAHMLVHQVKRLASPNIIVTNHDATVFPSIKIPSEPTPEGKPTSNRYLKFDRILADVPCSGDGTTRKNLEIWSKWTPSNGLGLHATQVRILIRALQMLKVGGRVVYSTCSMNPVEDEAVVAAAIERCGGPKLVNILETKDYLPGLKRYAGKKSWSIMDKSGRIWDDWESVVKSKTQGREDATAKLTESMFPPKSDLSLDRAMRIYPHPHDTGAFFVCILEKKSEIKVKADEKPAAVSEQSKFDIKIESDEKTITTPGPSEIDAPETNGAAEETLVIPYEDSTDIRPESPPESSKRKVDEIVPEESPAKRAKTEEISAPSTNGRLELTNKSNFNNKSKSTPFEEPFKYLSPTIPELSQISSFYNLSERFPRTRFLVRNPEGTATKNIYYTTQLAKDVLVENEGKGIKFVHAGVKMFVKQDAPSLEVCPWRIQTDGLRIVECWVGKERVVKLWRKETLRKLLIEMFPKFHGEEYKNLVEVGEQVRDMGMGCCVLVVEPTKEGEVRSAADGEGLTERMVFPLWKSIQSLNLMLPKEERKALLLRLFNDGSDLINLNHPGGKRPDPKGKQREKMILNAEESTESVKYVDAVYGAPAAEKGKDNGAHVRRNSSSPEID